METSTIPSPALRNKGGRPRGSKNKRTLEMERLAGPAMPAIIAKLIERATGGDVDAAKLLLQRMWRPSKGRPVQFALPAIITISDVPQALGAVLRAAAQGIISPDEAQSLADVLAKLQSAQSVADLAERVNQLEASNAATLKRAIEARTIEAQVEEQRRDFKLVELPHPPA